MGTSELVNYSVGDYGNVSIQLVSPASGDFNPEERNIISTNLFPFN